MHLWMWNAHDRSQRETAHASSWACPWILETSTDKQVRSNSDIHVPVVCHKNTIGFQNLIIDLTED